ncbi:TPA: hypothetical protein ACXZVU_004276 [Salmonella enterica]|nr:hypothetical protein [Klebsiella quasipneumoniae subsp. similipneumoniae]
MENNDSKVTKLEVSISFFYFLTVFLLFLSGIPKFSDFNFLSTPMAIGKIIMGFLLIFVVSYFGSSFIYKLLSYLEGLKNKSGD